MSLLNIGVRLRSVTKQDSHAFDTSNELEQYYIS